MVWRVWELLGGEEPFRRQLRREREAQLARLENERHQEREEQQKQTDTDTLMMLWLISEEYRQALAQLSNDTADAIAATRAAYERAQRDQEIASEALNAARSGAIRLDDGRRVYFTGDGRKLYGEDHAEIGDAALIEQAHQSHQTTPLATTHEAYVASEDQFSAASKQVEDLADALDRLDSIQARLAKGSLTKEELDYLREQQAAIVASLPDEAQHEYEQLQQQRQETTPAVYQALDADAEKAFSLTNHFRKADDPTKPVRDAGPEDKPATNGKAAYKAAPEF